MFVILNLKDYVLIFSIGFTVTYALVKSYNCVGPLHLRMSFCGPAAHDLSGWGQPTKPGKRHLLQITKQKQVFIYTELCCNLASSIPIPLPHLNEMIIFTTSLPYRHVRCLERSNFLVDQEIFTDMERVVEKL